ncbi:unnamed protein product [Paramecium primaurelia]|uniref:Uncharacterized protein n=1 Tax=Paramecium primaurelia TaxID=5886 RepID=A0A8S1KUF4_PARPR|nr:unnamed protein product [Paramecium primaurelia]CAD8058021.1 unnamed protein product [Paramecium primaurelia]
MAMQLTNEGKHEYALKFYDKSLSLFNIIDKIFSWKSNIDTIICMGQSVNSNYLHLIQYCIYKESKNEVNVVIWPYTQIIGMKVPITTKEQYDKRKEFTIKIDNLNQYEAIKCYDKAIQQNLKNDTAQNNQQEMSCEQFKIHYNEQLMKPSKIKGKRKLELEAEN